VLREQNEDFGCQTWVLKVSNLREQNKVRQINMSIISKLTGRGGRARTYDNRFWRPVLYQLSYTPTGNLRRGWFAPFQA
jgi:hypothetical protein